MAASIFDTSFLFTGDIMKILEHTIKGLVLPKVLYIELNGYFHHEKAGNKNKCSFRNMFNLICTQSKYLSRGAYKLTNK